MLNRFLIVGIGGSGGKTARFLHRELRYRLQNIDEWKEGMPDGWQFLHIDVPTEPDGNEASLPEQLPQVGGHYTSLSRPNMLYRHVDQGLLKPSADRDLLESYLGWRPVPEDVGVGFQKGAGQFRALGRMLALNVADDISKALRGAIGRINAPTTTGQLERLSVAMGNQPTDQQPVPIALIISSISGGSGAGMVNDVADILRANGSTWCDESLGFLYTGEIFQDLDQLDRNGIQPNSLAALCEVMAGYWNRAAPGPEFAPLADKGIEVGDVQRRGVRYPFLIGASNGVTTFGRQNDVYAALGRSLAALMTSAVAQDQMRAYGMGNWNQATSGIEDATGLRPAFGETPFKSIGSASVSLGRDRFARYASQRLARSCIEHLLRAHHVGKKVPDEVRPEDALAEAVTANWNWFVTCCGLDELGDQRNQVVDALRPPERSSRVEALRQEARARLARFPDATPPQWATLIAQDIGQAERGETGFISVDDGRLQQAAVAWVQQIQDQIVATVRQAIGRSGAGAEVTVALLNRLRRHITDVVVHLEEEERKYTRRAAMRDEGIRELLSQMGTANNIAPGNAAIDSSIQRAVKTLEFASEARIRRLAGVLLRDLAENQVVPLRDVVASAVSGLTEDETGDSVVKAWPQDDIIPAALQPAVNERLVEAPDEYPAIYRRLVSDTIGSPRIDEAIQTAVRQVSTGTRKVDGEDGEEVGDERFEDLDLGEVMVEASGWWPAEFNRIQSASRARYELDIEATGLLRRAEIWVGRSDSAIGAYVHESLRSYLTNHDDRGEQTRRRARFTEAFTAAMRLAPPLIGVSNPLLKIAHDLNEPRITYTFTEIPLDQTDVKQPVIEMMRTLGIFQGDDLKEREVADKAFGTGDEQSIEVITWFNAAFQPMVFDSVMRPIAAEWASRRTSEEGRTKFWQWRRARRLTDFVPLGPDDRRAAVAGWFVARLLGELTWTDDESPKVAITVPALRRQVGFPDPLLGPAAANEKDILAAVLESLPLAMVECNTTGTLRPLDPYRRLIELGSETGAQRALRQWILNDETPADTEPIARAHSIDGDGARQDATPLQRQEAVLTYLGGRINVYVTKLEKTVVDHYGFFDVPRHYALVEDYATSLRMLQRVAASVDIDADEDKGD